MQGADSTAGRAGQRRGPQRPREGVMGNSKHPRTNLGHIWEILFLSFFFGSENIPSLALNGCFGAKSRPQHGPAKPTVE